MNEGIPYFPFDVHLDDKFELIEAQYGLKGFAVVVKLYQKIYGGFGYYCEWTKDVALLFGKKIALGGNAVSEIVSASIERGIFDKGLYNECGILTSKGIQKRYFEAVNRRKQVNVKKAYLLVDVAKKYPNVNILSENVNINGENVYISKQRREEERREEESRGEDAVRTASATDTNLQAVVTKYQDNIAPITPMTHDLILDWLGAVNADVVMWAIKEAVKANARTSNYIDKIITTHASAGRTTMSDVMDHNRKRSQPKQQSYDVYDDKYDHAALEDIIRNKLR